MVHVPKQKRCKWDGKAHECRLVGFDEDTKGYRLYDPATKIVSRSRDVAFINEASYVTPAGGGCQEQQASEANSYQVRC